MAVDFYCSYNHTEEQKEQEEEEEEEDFIDMEVSSFCSNFLHQPKEFEFQMQSAPLEQDHLSTTSPADELFYQGKLLPLHLPPRLQMVEILLQNRPSGAATAFSTPLATNATPTPVSGTPFQSCHVSPAESCQVSRELNPEEYFLEYSSDGQFDHASKKLGWVRKLKLIKQNSSSRIKASRAYLKALFGKSSGHSNELTKCKVEGLSKETSDIKADEEKTKKNDKICHRRSFSGAFKLRSAAKSKILSSSFSSGSSSSSSSFGSTNNEVRALKRSNSASSELENSIEGAIAHCKKSQTQVLRSRKTFSEIGNYPTGFAGSQE